MAKINTIIFDLGGVLIDWNPEYLYKKLYEDPAEMKRFLKEVCTPQWNEQQDEGRSLHEATETLIDEYPAHEDMIRAYYGRWEEMLGGHFEETVDILKQLKEQPDIKTLALTNWSAETFPIAQERFQFLRWFDGIVVSGHEKTRKPFADIYNILLTRYNVSPANALFIDDNMVNVKGAIAVGMEGVQYLSAGQLKEELKKHDIRVV